MKKALRRVPLKTGSAAGKDAYQDSFSVYVPLVAPVPPL
jgi:hypothetical protein